MAGVIGLVPTTPPAPVCSTRLSVGRRADRLRYGDEGSILRYVFLHSIALACLVGVLVMLEAYVLTGMIVR
jgi:L-lactate permease